MTEPNGADSIDHPGDLLLPYLEDRLSGEDRAKVQAHINSCQECSHELRMLEELMVGLKATKDVFCPEKDQLFQFAETGDDPEGKLARHVERCPLCQEDVAAYRAGCEVPVLPAKVKGAYQERFAQLSPRSPEAPAKLRDTVTPAKAGVRRMESLDSGLRRNDGRGILQECRTYISNTPVLATLSEWLSSLLRVPSFALATVVAIVLVVVIIYPRGEIELSIGLSSVMWKQAEDDFAPKSLEAPAKKPRVAVILLFKGFKEQWPQQKIDSLYESLNPSEEAFERFDFVSPADIQVALKGKIDARDETQTQSRIVSQIDADAVMLIEVISRKSIFEINGLAIDAKSGKTMDRRSAEDVSKPQLSSKLPEVLAALLGSGWTIR